MLELLVPAPVDDAGDVECAAYLCVSVSGDEVLVVVPSFNDFPASVDSELVCDCADAVSDPESVIRTDNSFVGGVDLHVGTGASGQGAVVAGGGMGGSGWPAN
ncbi:hypothetical protein CVS28_14355 [Arthrobacter glacialis]|nr:hypothetical protein CVS28_14355 [Arthrobacter glacialis]